MKRFVIAFLAVAFVCGSTARAKVTFPSVISDNMILQQNTAVTLWGWSDSGKSVSVTTGWDKKKTVTRPDAFGKWTVKVNTPSASCQPYEITVSDGEKVTLKNILIGEVWFCSGQSNMEMPVKGYGSQPAEGGTDAILAARPERPIRICNIKSALRPPSRNKLRAVGSSTLRRMSRTPVLRPISLPITCRRASTCPWASS